MVTRKDLFMAYYYGPNQTRGGPRKRYFWAEYTTNELLQKAKEEARPGCKVTSIYLSPRRGDSVLVWDRKKGYRESDGG